MNLFFWVWLLTAVAVISAVYLVKSLRGRRFAVLNDLHWPGLIVIALIVGAFPAFLFHNQASRTVAVPDGVAERPVISNPGKN